MTGKPIVLVTRTGDMENLASRWFSHAEILDHWCVIVLFYLVVHHPHAFHLYVKHLHQAATSGEGGVGSQSVVTSTTSLDGEVDHHFDRQTFDLPEGPNEILAFTAGQRLIVRKHDTLVHIQAWLGCTFWVFS